MPCPRAKCSPPGQLCYQGTCRSKYAACDVPVYFATMDDNPGKLDQWTKRERSADSAAPVYFQGEPDS